MKKGFPRSTVILFMLQTFKPQLSNEIIPSNCHDQISAISRFKFVEVILFTFDTKRNTGNEFQLSRPPGGMQIVSPSLEIQYASLMSWVISMPLYNYIKN